MEALRIIFDKSDSPEKVDLVKSAVKSLQGLRSDLTVEMYCGDDSGLLPSPVAIHQKSNQEETVMKYGWTATIFLIADMRHPQQG